MPDESIHPVSIDAAICCYEIETAQQCELCRHLGDQSQHHEQWPQAAKLPEGDGYHAAITNFRYLANALWSTDAAVERVKSVE